ncbi:MAG: adenylate kinase [Acidimicrobiia bacterium]
MSSGPPRFLVLGRQGAGKGTQAVRLAEQFAVPHISTGDMFRAAQRDGTEFGNRAKAFMDRGELVPDEVVIGVVAERLAQDDALTSGFLLDGFPRTVSQAEELDRVLVPESLDAAIDIDVPTDVVLRRLSGRRVCEQCGATYHVDAPPKNNWTCDVDGGAVIQREDDTEEAISRRLELYERETGPLIDFYGDRGLLVRVDGVGTVDEVFERTLRAVAERPPFGCTTPSRLGVR